MTQITHRALLIGNSVFERDSIHLPTLNGPPNDISALERVLTDSKIGLHDPDHVSTLLDADHRTVLETMDEFFGSAGSDDQLLLYYSGHGYTDLYGKLYLCVKDTRTDKLNSSAIADITINSMIMASMARRFCLILDSRFSGSFKGARTVSDELSGLGRFVISSSQGAQLANDAKDSSSCSLFTKALVNSIEHGPLDNDRDGVVMLSELYDDIFRTMRKHSNQIPQRSFDRAVGDLPIARRNAPIRSNKNAKASRLPGRVKAVENAKEPRRENQKLRGGRTNSEEGLTIEGRLTEVTTSKTVRGAVQVDPPNAPNVGDERSHSREPLPKAMPGLPSFSAPITIESYSLTLEIIPGPSPALVPGKAPAQLLAAYRGARVINTFETRGGMEGQRFRKIIAMNERLRTYVNGGQATLPTSDEILAFGEVLFDVLFASGVRRLYDVARSDVRATRLNVILTSMVSWVSDKPWELAFDRGRGVYLATEEIEFVRNVLTDMPAQMILPRSGKMRILLVVAQALNMGVLSAVEEEVLFRRRFDPLIEAELIQVDVMVRATPASLHNRLNTGDYDVVHFVGHGEFDSQMNRGYLVFSDDRGEVQKLEDRALREIFSRRGIRLVYLSACETGMGGRADFNRGVAPALVAGGVPIVVANQYKTLDASATTFALHLYGALAAGMTIGAAARESRIAVNYSVEGGSIDWALPAVYARDGTMRLSAPTEFKPTVAWWSTSRARQAAVDHTHRIAIWDVDNLFPDLESTLSKLSAAQTRFGFILTGMSVPFGAWRLGTGKGAKVISLEADRTAKMLGHNVREFGVTSIIAITRNVIASEGVKNLSAWWSTNPSIHFVSLAKFQFPPSGLAVKKAIANVLVGALAVKFSEMGYHEKGSSRCPQCFDSQHSFDRLIDHHQFDSACRRVLRKMAPNELAALEKLLDVYYTSEKEK